MRHSFGLPKNSVSSISSHGETPADNSAELSDVIPIDSESIRTQHATDSTDGQSFQLSEILPQARICGADELSFSGVCDRAQQCQPGQLVIYQIGRDDPSEVIAQAMARGAAGILTEQLLPCPLPQCVVGNVDSAIASIRRELLDRPDRKLLTVGVLGAAGKTSTALLVASLLKSNGARVSYQTDLGRCDGVLNETPEQPITTGAHWIDWIADCVDSGSQASVMELHDDQLRQGVFDEIEFDVLIVTGAANLVDDFGPCGLQCALERLAPRGVVIAPSDDKKTMRPILDSGSRVVTYSTGAPADLTATLIEQSCAMTTLLLTSSDLSTMMETPLCGTAMAANIAATAMLGVLLDQPLYEVAESISKFRQFPGRGQRLSDYENASVVIDAGGAPDRVALSLKSEYRMRAGGKLWCVLAMSESDTDDDLALFGQTLERYADHAIVTCTPPMKRNFLRRSHTVLDGVQECAAMRLVADWKRAVCWAVAEASPRDTILVIGGFGGRNPKSQREQIETIERWVSNERNVKAGQLGGTQQWGTPEDTSQSDTPKLKIFRPE